MRSRWATSSTEPAANSEAALSTFGFTVLAPCWAPHILAAGPFISPLRINQGPRMLSTAACTQVMTLDASFFPGLAQPWGQMSPSLYWHCHFSGPCLTRPPWRGDLQDKTSWGTHACLQPPLVFNTVTKVLARATRQRRAQEQSKCLLLVDKRKVCQETAGKAAENILEIRKLNTE